uniref:PH domain-containing protein n=1 Tax=Parastrongyloides trichosuri TaxID=131310 RepID=A0A0N4ZSU4_PARTI
MSNSIYSTSTNLTSRSLSTPSICSGDTFKKRLAPLIYDDFFTNYGDLENIKMPEYINVPVEKQKPPMIPNKGFFKTEGSIINHITKNNQTSNVKDKHGILRSLSFQFSPFRGTKIVDTPLSNGTVLRKMNENNYNTKSNNQGEVGPLLGVQMYGCLLKKYKKKNRPVKWKKRFFILKECFLLYYSCKIKKEFETTRRINLHPKGIIPLIGCSIISGGDVGKKYCLLITHCQFDSAIIVCATDIKCQENWFKALRDSTKISYKNTIYGEHMIRELETKGNLLTEEKKKFEERLQLEALARQEERERNYELEKTREELEKEREKLVKITVKMKEDIVKVKNDLVQTNEEKLKLENEKILLLTKTEHLVTNMECLNLEKTKIEDQMNQILRERETFLLENQNLSSVTCQLKNRMQEIENKTSKIATEKEKIECLMKLNEQKTLELERERVVYTKQTKELLKNLKVVSEQKEMTEAELKDEMIARMGAERQLYAAEKALEHLENALKLTGAQMAELQEHIMPDVHKLREFFEKCAIDAKLEAQNALIMRNAVYARRSFRKNPTKCKTRANFRRHVSLKEDRRNFEIQSLNNNDYS